MARHCRFITKEGAGSFEKLAKFVTTECSRGINNTGSRSDVRPTPA